MAEWMKDAACRDHEDPDLWFPGADRDNTLLAKAICAECPVQIDCLTYARTERIDHGIWGGLTPAERRKIRRLK